MSAEEGHRTGTCLILYCCTTVNKQANRFVIVPYLEWVTITMVFKTTTLVIMVVIKVLSKCWVCV